MHGFRKGMKNENGEDRKRTQSIDIRTIPGRFGVMVYGMCAR